MLARRWFLSLKKKKRGTLYECPFQLKSLWIVWMWTCRIVTCGFFIFVWLIFFVCWDSFVWHVCCASVDWVEIPIHGLDSDLQVCGITDFDVWRAMTHSSVWHDLFMYVTWLIHLWHDWFMPHRCDVALSHECHDRFMYVTLTHSYVCDITHSYVWHDSFICVTWRIHMCDMAHSYVRHESCICVTWLIHMRDMTHSYVWHDSFIRVTWLIHMCDMTHSYVTW